MVVDPLDLLALDSPYRLNDLYYINKKSIPALQRVFGLVGADLNQWFLEMSRPVRESVGKRHLHAAPSTHKKRIDYYYLSKHCVLCGELVRAPAHLCTNCSKDEASVAIILTGRASKFKREMHHLAAICGHCGGGGWLFESGVKCTSLACSVFYERRKVQKELRSHAAVATELATISVLKNKFLDNGPRTKAGVIMKAHINKACPTWTKVEEEAIHALTKFKESSNSENNATNGFERSVDDIRSDKFN